MTEDPGSGGLLGVAGVAGSGAAVAVGAANGPTRAGGAAATAARGGTLLGLPKATRIPAEELDVVTWAVNPVFGALPARKPT